MIAPYCSLSITHPARAYVHSTHQTPERLAELFRQHSIIHVCDVKNSPCKLLKNV